MYGHTCRAVHDPPPHPPRSHPLPSAPHHIGAVLKVSTPSTGLGYKIGLMIHQRCKPCLCISRKVEGEDGKMSATRLPSALRGDRNLDVSFRFRSRGHVLKPFRTAPIVWISVVCVSQWLMGSEHAKKQESWARLRSSCVRRGAFYATFSMLTPKLDSLCHATLWVQWWRGKPGRVYTMALMMDKQQQQQM